jgi:sulfide:quinone oxidoreductase
MRKRVVVLGSNFGGLTAALSIKQSLHGDVDVQVISPNDRFLFTPSLIWLPFGKRTARDITFPVEPTFTENDVDFVHAAATAIDADTKVVTTDRGTSHPYDQLVVATGFRNDMEAVPGLAENAVTITTLDDAKRARTHWQSYLDDPGDVVVAAAQGAGCFGAAYEYLFNTSYRLRKAGLHRHVKLTYVTAEPFLGHFGLGGLPHGEALLRMFTEKEGISVVTGAAIDHVASDAVVLDDGTELPSSYSMVVPPFTGQDVIRSTAGFTTDQRGFVLVRPTYQTEKYDDIYVIGAAAAVDVPWQTAVPVGIPKTGYPTEVQAHTAADNISALIRGDAPLVGRSFSDIPAVCVMDAGNNGVIILADHMLPPRKHAALIPGPQAHLMKVGFEKYFLWKARHGYVGLP